MNPCELTPGGYHGGGVGGKMNGDAGIYCMSTDGVYTGT